MALKSSVLKRDLTYSFKNKEPFWDKYKGNKYSELNDVLIPDANQIKAYQLEKIQRFSDSTLAADADKYGKINELFLSGKINSLPAKYEASEKQTLDKFVSSLVGIMNGSYRAQKKDQENGKKIYNYKKLEKTLTSLGEKIKSINALLSKGGTEATLIPESYLQAIDKALTACSSASGSQDVAEWFAQLNNFKGALIEDLGVAWLRAINYPDLLTINTGSISLQATKGKTLSNNRHKGQLIQDLMQLDISDGDILNTKMISYKPVDGDGYITTTLNEFIAHLEGIKSKSKQISLTDEGYTTLLELSAMNIQSKSGFNQLPWNDNKSTQISIGEFEEDNLSSITVKHTFELLHSLDLDNIPKKDIWVKDTSNDYNALANYGLATILFKVLHLGQEGNKFLLTPQGFVSYPNRIAYLMNKRNGYINIKGQVTIDNNTLGNKYSVKMDAIT